MQDMIPAWVNGVLTPVEKLDAHVRGLRHKAVSVFVMHGSEVLIQQRAAGKYHTPLMWANTCCTHPHWGEDSAECAVRRLNEELGMTGIYPSHRGTLEYRADVGHDLIEHEVVDVFVAVCNPRPPVNPNPDEVAATEWVDYYELKARVERHPEKFTPWLRIYMTEHADKIFGHLPVSNGPTNR